MLVIVFENVHNTLFFTTQFEILIHLINFINVSNSEIQKKNAVFF